MLLVWLLLRRTSMGSEMLERRERDARGFTMLEVIIALALAGAIGFIAAPTISATKAQYDLTSAANTLAFEITRTRMQAIGQNNFMRVRSVSSTQYVRERSTDGVTYTQEGTPTTLPDYVTLTVGDTGSPTFNRSGISNASTSFTVSRQIGTSTFTKTVATSILGRVSIL
jgi:prepilin-type N-terminal cleavage/methylation domain-containing protein